MSAPVMVCCLALIIFSALALCALYRIKRPRRLKFKANAGKVSLSFEVRGEDDPKRLPPGVSDPGTGD